MLYTLYICYLCCTVLCLQSLSVTLYHHFLLTDTEHLKLFSTNILHVYLSLSVLFKCLFAFSYLLLLCLCYNMINNYK